MAMPGLTDKESEVEKRPWEAEAILRLEVAVVLDKINPVAGDCEVWGGRRRGSEED
jgi:hypothetical protein